MKEKKVTSLKIIFKDGNAGAADYCSSSRAGMWCRAGDRKITVKEYSYGKEEE